jgi:hypothetical protein
LPEIDKFEVRSGLKGVKKNRFVSNVVQQVEELHDLGIRKARPPDYEPFVYGLGRKPAKVSPLLLLALAFPVL